MIDTSEMETSAAPSTALWRVPARSRCSGSGSSWALPERSTHAPWALRLVVAAGLRDVCDLDVLLFFSGHPRVALSSEQLAAYVGYDVVEVARALDLLLGAGVLTRTSHRGAPGRMYVLEIARVEEWLEPLRLACATPDGRNALRAVLRTGGVDHA